MNTNSIVNLYSNKRQMILLNDSLYTFKLSLKKDHAYIISGKLMSNNLSKDTKAICTIDFITNAIREEEYPNYGLNYSKTIGAYKYIYALNQDGDFHIKFKAHNKHEVLCTVSAWMTNESLYCFSELTIEEVEIKKESNSKLIIDDVLVHEKEEILKKFNKSFENTKTRLDFCNFNNKKKSIEYKVFAIALGTSNINPFIFSPRKGLNEIELQIPIDWDMDPFNDSNWKFQFHAWRMLGNVLFTFEKTQNAQLLDKVFSIIFDWYSFAIQKNNENNFIWSDMATGIRASIISYLINRLIKINSPRKMTDKEKFLLFKLAKMHIEKLFRQNLANSNHGIFQMHGLIMLLDCFGFFNIKEMRQYAHSNMSKLFHSQFDADGMQSENSDEYHRFMVFVFSNILDKSIYIKLQSELKILEKAKTNNDYLVFPNSEGLMLGDTGYFCAKKKNTTDKLHFFKHSGYLYFNENKKSMLFITSAFNNIIHKHADHFNFLWYEDDMNILVDSGKYSYDKSEKRDYYMSSRAHNVIVIDNQDYMINTKKYFSTALKYYKKEQYGYSVRLTKCWDEFDVEHNRYYFYGADSFLIVIDVLDSNQYHTYQQIFHFNESLKLTKKNDFYVTRLKEKYMSCTTQTLSRNCKTSLLHGQVEPIIQGWRSINYNEEVPNIAMINEVKTNNEVFVTAFLLHDHICIDKPNINIMKGTKDIQVNISYLKEINLILDIDSGGEG